MIKERYGSVLIKMEQGGSCIRDTAATWNFQTSWQCVSANRTKARKSVYNFVKNCENLRPTPSYHVENIRYTSWVYLIIFVIIILCYCTFSSRTSLPKNWDSSVGMATVCQLEHRGIWVRVHVGQEFPLLHNIQTDSGAHPISYPIGTGAGALPGG
jgi:hypothetical protein